MQYQDKANAKIEILRDRVSNGHYFDVEACLRHIHNGTGDPYACKAELQEYSWVRALLAWFTEGDLTAFKQWSFVSAKLLRTLYQERPNNYYMTAAHLSPLLSDNEDLIEWFSKLEYPFAVKGGYSSPELVAKPNTLDFHHYNTLLAVRGDWDKLASRCQLFLEEIPPKSRSYEADCRFMLSLAKGDISAMEDALKDLVKPVIMKRREMEESGNTQSLISSVAVVYAKVAWYHGFHVQFDSPMIPEQWLPIKPLTSYDDHFDFLAATDNHVPVPPGA